MNFASISSAKMPSVLVVGATRGLGACLIRQYATQANHIVYGTTRSENAPEGFPENVKWLSEVDLTDSGVGDRLVTLLGSARPLSTVVS